MSYINWFKRVFTGNASDNTAEGAIIRSGGQHISKTITLSASATSASVNCFQVTGYNEVFNLHGEITAVTTLTNCNAVYFDLWDGTVSVPITKTTGAVLSGYGVGSGFVKDSDVASALTTMNNNQCRMQEAAVGAKESAKFLVLQKLSTNTYIRFNYTTTDAPINATLSIQIVFADIDSGTITAV